ncbi:hypothetical protein [Vitreimonas flagellata]|uniref:hypothetical protein n=1 Tax=Vitreimonas flagellata TaxID=2560861 RepID=UPI00107544A4|nr:hypothetical protein [Vitreimonas flagellata]
MRKPLTRTTRKAHLETRKTIMEVLDGGAVLWFTGHHFEERGRLPGKGPTYPTAEVLRVVRTGHGLATTRAAEGRPGWFDIEVRAAPKRSQAALGAVA